jgi:hypothetical protein
MKIYQAEKILGEGTDRLAGDLKSLFFICGK